MLKFPDCEIRKDYEYLCTAAVASRDVRCPLVAGLEAFSPTAFQTFGEGKGDGRGGGGGGVSKLVFYAQSTSAVVSGRDGGGGGGGGGRETGGGGGRERL